MIYKIIEVNKNIVKKYGSFVFHKDDGMAVIYKYPDYAKSYDAWLIGEYWHHNIFEKLETIKKEGA